MAPAGYVYLIRGAARGLHKIGVSIDPHKRVDQLPKTQGPLTLVHVIASDDPHTLEGRLHAAFADRRVGGEWFSLAADDVDRICSLAGPAPDWLPPAPTPRFPGPVAAEFRTSQSDRVTLTVRMSPAALVQIARIRAYHSLTTDTAAVAFALGATDRGIPPDYVPPEQ